MQQIIQTIQQALIEEQIPTEQVQNIISSIDVSQLNILDLPATTEYISQFMSNIGLQENIIDHINTNLAESLGNFGTDNIADLGVDPKGLMDNIKNIFGGFLGG